MQVTNIKGLVPNIFTMGNIVCGFVAILATIEGQVTTACWLIILGSLLDALDGKIARLSDSGSQFGRELDSLADFLTFGIAPAVIVYLVELQHIDKWGWLICILFIGSAAFRLARYNLQASDSEKKNFIGLPMPAAAITLVGYVIFAYYIWGEIQYGEYLIIMMVGLSVLMISQIEYDSIPDNLYNRKNLFKVIFLLVATILLIINHKLLLFPIIAVYVIMGLARELYRFFIRHERFSKKPTENSGETME